MRSCLSYATAQAVSGTFMQRVLGRSSFTSFHLIVTHFIPLRILPETQNWKCRCPCRRLPWSHRPLHSLGRSLRAASWLDSPPSLGSWARGQHRQGGLTINISFLIKRTSEKFRSHQYLCFFLGTFQVFPGWHSSRLPSLPSPSPQQTTRCSMAPSRTLLLSSWHPGKSWRW